MILFCAALSKELDVIKNELKELNLKTKIKFLNIWVWSLNTIYNLKEFIDKNDKIDFVINIWVCGKKENTSSDFFQVYKIKNISNKKESICPLYIKNLELKSINCSDKIITNTLEIDENYVDMESFWFDFLCKKEKLPYIIIKKPFDIVWNDSKNVSIKNLQDSLKWFDYKKLIENINIFLDKNKKNNSINDFIDKLEIHLTFSQKELLKKYINKEISYWKKYSEIFEEIKNFNIDDIEKII